MKSDYSKKEFAMIQICSQHWANIVCLPHLKFNPVSVLECVAMECFLENKRGLAVNSLRRCLNALKNSKMYRGTPEYEALIVLNDDNDDTFENAMTSAFGWHGQG